MEKKTIGSFIAALRRANGLTQRELAEKLNVSDKAVSRWERDESLPDLTLIPALAEIFSVTSDELLRGERASGAPTPEAEERAAAKTEKQKENLLRSTAAGFRAKSLIAGGLALAGLLGAMICNFAFLRANLGFLVGCLFYLAAALCEAVFLNGALASLGWDREDPGTGRCRYGLCVWAGGVWMLTAALLAASLPLVLLIEDAYMGLSGGDWACRGLILGGLGLALALSVELLILDRLSRRGLLGPDEARRGLFQLRGCCALVTLLVMLLTVPVQLGLSQGQLYTESTVFDNYKDFAAFMETETEPDWAGAPADSVAAPVPEEGWEETEEPPLTITGRDGEILCSYYWKNRQVAYISYSSTEGESCLPITVQTYEQQRHGDTVGRAVFAALCPLYALEPLAGLAVYAALKEKMNKKLKNPKNKEE